MEHFDHYSRNMWKIEAGDSDGSLDLDAGVLFNAGWNNRKKLEKAFSPNTLLSKARQWNRIFVKK